uniref:Uncharacterized protein n=1 Tax=Oryza meridionalis TaxID=40149 RepID=A0A0E0DEM7_9ORYZ
MTWRPTSSASRTRSDPSRRWKSSRRRRWKRIPRCSPTTRFMTT